jgi:hypothetical protein
VAQNLPSGAVAYLSRLYESSLPLADLTEHFPSTETDATLEKIFSTRDKERFPLDLPDDLLRGVVERQAVADQDAELPKQRGR